MILFLLVAAASALSPQECLHQLQHFSLEKDCFNLLLSKFLGYSLVGASLMLKFPQILKIYHNSSVTGISLTSFYVETLGFSIMAAYGFHNGQPFSTFGEHALISVQCVIQVLLFWNIGKVGFTERATVGVMFLSLWVVPLFGDLMPEVFWKYVPIYTTLMNLVVKISQIRVIFETGSTGNLSFITNLLNFLGVLSRIFTTLTELNDPMLLTSYMVGAILNAIIMAQFAFYWNAVSPKKAN